MGLILKGGGTAWSWVKVLKEERSLEVDVELTVQGIPQHHSL